MYTMRAYAVWIFFGLVVLVLLALALFFFLPSKSAPLPTPTTTLPDADSISPSGSGGSGALPIQGKRGSVTVSDFIHNGITAPDPQNSGTYYLAGSPCSDTPYPGCPEGARTNNFSIAYDEGPQFFTVSLINEPLGKARIDAERFLQNALGISQEQLCTLNYYVGTTYYVNQQYSSKNLGFSFCPNATVLP